MKIKVITLAFCIFSLSSMTDSFAEKKKPEAKVKINNTAEQKNGSM
jgi:hypothetical protein